MYTQNKIETNHSSTLSSEILLKTKFPIFKYRKRRNPGQRHKQTVSAILKKIFQIFSDPYQGMICIKNTKTTRLEMTFLHHIIIKILNLQNKES